MKGGAPIFDRIEKLAVVDYFNSIKDNLKNANAAAIANNTNPTDGIGYINNLDIIIEAIDILIAADDTVFITTDNANISLAQGQVFPQGIITQDILNGNKTVATITQAQATTISYPAFIGAFPN